jgi:hypothetical protein
VRATQFPAHTVATSAPLAADELVEDGLITPDDFRDVTFTNAVRLWGTQNPRFRRHPGRQGSRRNPRRNPHPSRAAAE